jgi:hypothetical protein
MRQVAAVAAVLGSAAGAEAAGWDFVWPADRKGKEPVAQRTTTPKHPVMRGGSAVEQSRFATSGISPHECGGYVGGGGVCRGTAPGPCDGTFGWDYVLFKRKPSRIFLNFFADTKHTETALGKYEQDGRRLPGDPIGEAPFRKAVREAKAEKHAEAHGEGHAGEGGH